MVAAPLFRLRFTLLIFHIWSNFITVWNWPKMDLELVSSSPYTFFVPNFKCFFFVPNFRPLSDLNETPLHVYYINQFFNLFLKSKLFSRKNFDFRIFLDVRFFLRCNFSSLFLIVFHLSDPNEICCTCLIQYYLQLFIKFFSKI